MKYVEWDTIEDILDILKKTPLVTDSDDSEGLLELVYDLLGMNVKVMPDASDVIEKVRYKYEV